MSKSYPLHTVDVFAERQLAGNQLAVIEDAADLTDQQMQAIALEMNYAETTFVTAQQGDEATVRIFTPAWELPFAGHPTIGTAWVLTQGKGRITLNLQAGKVPVEFSDGVGWMVPPAVQFHGDFEPELAADLISLPSEDLAGVMPVELLEVGPNFIIIPVRNLDALRRAKLHADLHTQLVDQGYGVQCVFVVSVEPYEANADFATRMFFDAAGKREDSATGSANSAFAAYLRKHRGHVGQVVVDQGVEINRPSRLYLKVGESIAVGGRVQPVIKGEITIEGPLAPQSVR